jgi:hypothetical protein
MYKFSYMCMHALFPYSMHANLRVAGVCMSMYMLAWSFCMHVHVYMCMNFQSFVCMYTSIISITFVCAIYTYACMHARMTCMTCFYYTHTHAWMYALRTCRMHRGAHDWYGSLWQYACSMNVSYIAYHTTPQTCSKHAPAFAQVPSPSQSNPCTRYVYLYSFAHLRTEATCAQVCLRISKCTCVQALVCLFALSFTITHSTQRGIFAITIPQTHA